MSAPASVPDTALGFTQSELQILRQQQQLIARGPSQRGTMPDRGRGTSRHSQPSSRAASAASSQSVPGRIVLDPRSLQSLSASLDSLLATMSARIQSLENLTQQSVNASASRAGQSMASTEEQIKRMKTILADMDRLEAECDKIRHIRDVVKQLRSKVDTTSEKFDKLPTNHHPLSHVSVRPDPRRR